MSAPLCGVNENGQLEKSYIADGLPIGTVIPFYGSTPPAHTLACNGAAISRTAYAELFTVIGTTAGAGDGSTTFNVPDLRGMFIRGTGGNAAALGVEQGDAIRRLQGEAILRTFIGNDGSIGAFFLNTTGIWAASAGEESDSVYGLQQNNMVQAIQKLTFDTNFGGYPNANENRPVNVAMTYCIVYEN